TLASVRRLGFTQRIPVVLADELGITEVTKLSQHMGNQILHGREAIVSDLDDSGLWVAEDVGFKVLLDGEDGVRQFVTDAYDRAVADGDRGMSNALFDRFHYFLNSEASVGLFGTVKQIIIDRMSELLPYGPGDTPTFGVTAIRRHWHTLASAERQYGLPYRTIRKLVERAGIVEPLNTDVQKTRAVINAKALDDLLSGGGAQENHYNTAKRLGAHWTHFRAFEEAGLLLPVLRGENKHNFTYLRRDLARFEQALMRHAHPQAGELEGMVSMRQAYVATDWSLAEVVKHVMAGDIPCASVIGMKPVESIRLDLTALRCLHPFGSVETITVKEAAAMLRVSETVISKLITTRRIAGFRQRIPDRNGRRWVVSQAEMEEFRGRYIAASEIWRKGMGLSKITREMAAHGIEAQFPPDELRCTFYLREQVDRALSTG
ncbi:MAG: DNA-binding protein, partial [Alphaproteobacteria bacterium]